MAVIGYCYALPIKNKMLLISTGEEVIAIANTSLGRNCRVS